MENHSFQADAKQILRLVTHSIYSEKEIFIRELLSNASDALDKARFIGLKDGNFRSVEDPKIRMSFNAETKTITIEDDGVGMTKEEVMKNIGTIAQSGTKNFLEGLDAGDKLEALIGQFGVGFYSAFMVADKVVIDTLSIHEDAEAVRWESDGTEGYSLGESEKETRGTTITIYLTSDNEEFAEEYRLKSVAQKYSGFVQWPIFLGEERLNDKAALWTRDPSEITAEEYTEFYKHVTGDWQEPLTHVHIRTESPVAFQAVLFVPKKHSMNLDNVNYNVDLKLYQKRVQVIEHANDLLPHYLRFVCGVVDSPDIQLNVSREILQKDSKVEMIKKQITKKILGALKDLASEKPEEYIAFWEDMGMLLKAGIPEDEKQKKKIFDLLRFKTTTSLGDWRSLAEVKESISESEGQDTIWYLPMSFSLISGRQYMLFLI